MKDIQIWAIASTGGGAAVALVLSLVSWARFFREKGFGVAMPWLLGVPAPFTKVVYMLMLIVVSKSAEKPVGDAWLLGATAAFALTALSQGAVSAWRISKERRSALSVPAPQQTLSPFMSSQTFVPVRVAMHLAVLGMFETLAVLVFVLSVTVGRFGSDTGNVVAREAGRITGGIVTSFAGGAVEGAKDAARTFETPEK